MGIARDEEGTASHSSIHAWRIPRTEQPAWWAIVHRAAWSRTRSKLQVQQRGVARGSQAWDEKVFPNSLPSLELIQRNKQAMTAIRRSSICI